MTVDYRRFLGQRETLVLPWLEGGSVDAPTRRLRCAAPPATPGWYRFEVQGRTATVVGPAEVPVLTALPKLRGPLIRLGAAFGLVARGAKAELLSLMPAEEPPLFAPVVARTWPGGVTLFESVEFESGAEESARRALEEDAGLLGVPGVSAALRAAFAYAVVDAASRRLQIPASRSELVPRLRFVIDEGRPAAEALLRDLERERLQVAEEMRAQAAQRAAVAHARAVEAERQRRAEEPPAAERVEAALEAAGARLLRTRQLDEALLEVTFFFLDERFTTVVHQATLQVFDAGICLGHPPADEELTLESLPAVIREAVDEGLLVMTRHA